MPTAVTYTSPRTVAYTLVHLHNTNLVRATTSGTNNIKLKVVSANATQEITFMGKKCYSHGNWDSVQEVQLNCHNGTPTWVFWQNMSSNVKVTTQVKS